MMKWWEINIKDLKDPKYQTLLTQAKITDEVVAMFPAFRISYIIMADEYIKKELEI